MTELIVTFVFVSICVNVKFLNGSDEIHGNAFAIGATLASCIIISANTTGGCVNPAVGIV